MDKFKEIRPIVLGIAKKNNKILVSEGYDKIKNETFYRCIGGGIEFLENSKEALKREFKEELNIEISVGDFLGISENIFTYNGKKAHEIVFMYDIEMDDSYYKEKYEIIDTAGTFEAKWIDINEFISGNKTLYPKVLISYLKDKL